MQVSRPDLLPAPDLEREAMVERQHAVASAATFADDHTIAIDAIDVGDIDVGADPPWPTGEGPTEHGGGRSEAPIVVGVDQAFRDETVLSVAVAIQDGAVIEEAHAIRPIEMPYVPGLLVFREGAAICGALEALAVSPDVVCFDGSGRIHYREAGLATHLGVVFDVPAVGVAKNLLCGRPRRSLEDSLPAGERVAIEADADVTATPGTLIGYAFQSRQFESGNRSINPLYVSPGHRLSAGTAVDVVAACGGAYKLPEPTRIADARVGSMAVEV